MISPHQQSCSNAAKLERLIRMITVGCQFVSIRSITSSFYWKFVNEEYCRFSLYFSLENVSFCVTSLPWKDFYNIC